MFTDARGKKVLLVAHCVLNQNARIDECAYFPGAMPEIARDIVDSGIGIYQLPCPELLCLGLDRAGRYRDGKDIGIREALLEGESGWKCRELAVRVMEDVTEYARHGFRLVGVVGNDGSPACGVVSTHYVDGERAGAGAFMLVLREELQARGHDLPFVATRDHEWEERAEVIRQLLDAAMKD